MNKAMKTVVAFVTGAALLAGSVMAQDRKGWPRSLTIGTASQGGVYFVYGNGLAGFIGEFVALTGSYPACGRWVLVAGAGLVITAAWHLITMRKVLLGEAKKEYAGLHDVTWKEKLIFAPVAVLIVLFGVYPKPILDILNDSVVVLSQVMQLGGK